MEFKALWRSIAHAFEGADPGGYLVLALTALVLIGLRWIATRRDVDEWLDAFGLGEKDVEREDVGS